MRQLGYRKAYPKLPYASVLFGDDAAGTLAKARAIRAQGFRAAKFGWGPYGAGSAKDDADHVMAAREGLGPLMRNGRASAVVPTRLKAIEGADSTFLWPQPE